MDQLYYHFLIFSNTQYIWYIFSSSCKLFTAVTQSLLMLFQYSSKAKMNSSVENELNIICLIEKQYKWITDISVSTNNQVKHI